MEIMWEHIFDLVERMWELNQNGIANCLGVDRSTISRLKNGKQLQFNHPCDEVYRNLFDPTNDKTPAFGKDSKGLLRDLKAEIEDVGWSDATNGVKDSDYKEFVIGLLRLAKENQSRLSTKNANTENKSNIQKANETQPERMLDVCQQSFIDYPIKDFIDSNPVNFLATKLKEDINDFINHIKFNQNRKDILDKDKAVFQTISSFTDCLAEYYEYLFDQMEERHIYDSEYPNKFIVSYEPPKDDSGKFKIETERYRTKLKSLYDEINNA